MREIPGKRLKIQRESRVITSQNAKDFRQLITDIVEDAAALPEQTEEKDDNKDE